MQIVPSASGTDTYTLAPLSGALKEMISNQESSRLSKIYGFPESWKKSCKTCLKKGTFRTRLQDEQVVTCECNCREQWMLGRRLLAAGIGDGYQRYSWHRVRGVSGRTIKEVLDYIDNLEAFVSSGIGLLLWSDTRGTDMSLLISLVLKEALLQGYRGYFTSCTEMVDHHTASWSDAEHRAWFANRIQSTGVLVIDNLGKENPHRADVVDELLDRVIRSRVAHGRPTIITSNLNPVNAKNVSKDFSRYQAGLLDMLSERSLIIEMDGPSYHHRRGVDLTTESREGIRYPVVMR